MSNFAIAESVCAGHPDKICDQISDAIVDAALRVDPQSRVAVETLATFEQLVIAGEVHCPASLDYDHIAREVIRDLGYTHPKWGFSHKSKIDVHVHEQSADIAQGVDQLGAGDQGLMFGYACRETSEFMPLPIALAHALAEKLDSVKSKELPQLRPDGKTEVVLESTGSKTTLAKLVIAVPHDPDFATEDIRSGIWQEVVAPTLELFSLRFSPTETNFIVNGTGRWEIGGPASDTGVTGRKIVVDAYGGACPVGGGCFSGKDPTKVDRSGAYAARYVAKNIVAAGLADRAQVQLAYVIGRPLPLAVQIDCFGTAQRSDRYLREFANKCLDLSVAGILQGLDLRRPIYTATARYGHFGHSEYPWEKLQS